MSVYSTNQLVHKLLTETAMLVLWLQMNSWQNIKKKAENLHLLQLKFTQKMKYNLETSNLPIQTTILNIYSLPKVMFQNPMILIQVFYCLSKAGERICLVYKVFNTWLVLFRACLIKIEQLFRDLDLMPLMNLYNSQTLKL